MDKPTPSEAQLELLDLLWQHQPATVQQLHDELTKRREVSYNTVSTQLQRMDKSGLVVRDKSQRTHTYTAAYSRQEVESGVFDRLAKTISNGSTFDLALRALGNQAPTPDELDELQAWINAQKK